VALLLEPCHVAGEDRALAFRQTLELVEVDGQLRREGRLGHRVRLLG